MSDHPNQNLAIRTRRTGSVQDSARTASLQDHITYSDIPCPSRLRLEAANSGPRRFSVALVGVAEGAESQASGGGGGLAFVRKMGEGRKSIRAGKMYSDRAVVALLDTMMGG